MDELKELIRKSMLHKDYDKAIELLKTYPKKEWVKYYNLAKCYKSKDNLENSLIIAEESIQYTLKEESDYKYLFSLWLIAECEAELGNKKEAADILDTCVRGFDLLNEMNLKLCCEFNKHRHLENLDELIDIIEEYEKVLIDCSEIENFGDMQKDELLQQMYISTYKLSKEKNMYALAEELEIKIENIELKKKLKE